MLSIKTFKYLIFDNLCHLHKNIDYRGDVQSKDSFYNIKRVVEIFLESIRTKGALEFSSYYSRNRM